jgi:hypothetical protein
MVKEQKLAWPVGQVDKTWRAEATQRAAAEKAAPVVGVYISL